MANTPRNAPRAANEVKKCCRAEHASGGALRERRFVFAPLTRFSIHPHVQNALSHFRQCAGEKGSYLTYGQCRQKQPGHASDERVETCREAGIELISRVAGKSPATATATAARHRARHPGRASS